MASDMVPGNKLSTGDVLNAFAEGLQQHSGLVLKGAGIMALIGVASLLLLPQSVQGVASLLQIPVQYWLYEQLLRADGLTAQGGADRRYLAFFGLSLLIAIGVGIGFILLIVPGLILYARWSVALPVLVGEGATVGDSLRQSWELTRPSQWAIVLGTLVLGLVLMLLYGALALAGLVVSLLVGAQWISAALGALAGAVSVAFTVALYRRLGARSAAYGQVFG